MRRDGLGTGGIALAVVAGAHVLTQWPFLDFGLLQVNG